MFKFLNKRISYSILVLLGILLLSLSFSNISHFEGATDFTAEIKAADAEVKTSKAAYDKLVKQSNDAAKAARDKFSSELQKAQQDLNSKRQKLQKLQKEQSQAKAAKPATSGNTAAKPAQATTTAAKPAAPATTQATAAKPAAPATTQATAAKPAAPATTTATTQSTAAKK